MDPNMLFDFTPDGLRDLEGLDHEVRERVLRKLKYWQATKNPLKYAISLEGRAGLFRFRVGDWHIIVSRGKETIDILAIGHRSKIYEK